MNALKKSLVFVALLMVGIFSVNPASAHTEVDHTSPAQGATVAAGTQTVSVVFTDKILNLANSSEIVITDEKDEPVATSCVEVKNTSLNVEALLATPGDYKVVWRTVAEDGHPITGNFGFTVTGTATDANFVNCKTMASQGTAVVTAPKPSKPVTAVAVVWPYWLVAGLVLVAGAIVLIRRNGSKG